MSNENKSSFIDGLYSGMNISSGALVVGILSFEEGEPPTGGLVTESTGSLAEAVDMSLRQVNQQNARLESLLINMY